jgi:hypothetical protein
MGLHPARGFVQEIDTVGSSDGQKCFSEHLLVCLSLVAVDGFSTVTHICRSGSKEVVVVVGRYSALVIQVLASRRSVT